MLRFRNSNMCMHGQKRWNLGISLPGHLAFGGMRGNSSFRWILRCFSYKKIWKFVNKFTFFTQFLTIFHGHFAYVLTLNRSFSERFLFFLEREFLCQIQCEKYSLEILSIQIIFLWSWWIFAELGFKPPTPTLFKHVSFLFEARKSNSHSYLC